MKVICKPRAGGKTTELLQMALDHHYAFVCHSQAEYRRLLDICRDANQEPPLFLTYEQFIEGRLRSHREIRGVVIDNADMLLQRLAGPVEVKGVALNSEVQDA